MGSTKSVSLFLSHTPRDEEDYRISPFYTFYSVDLKYNGHFPPFSKTSSSQVEWVLTVFIFQVHNL